MGHIVAGFGRRKENVSALRKELNITDELLVTSLDITDTESIESWGKSLIQKYGSPFMVIHNAGSVIGCNKDTWELDMADAMKSYQIHVGGAMVLCKVFIPVMREQNKGMMINISSWAGQNGYATGTPYCCSKFAIEGLTQCLAKELDDANMNNAVLACCVSPGFVNTSMLKGSFAEQAAKTKNVEDGDQWAEKTCEWMMSLHSIKDENGKMLYHGKSIGCPLEKESMKKYVEFFKVYGVEMEYEKYIHEPNK